jgi:hypothetical protein
MEILLPNATRLNPADLLPGERASIIEEANEIFEDGGEWLRQPHPFLAGLTPLQCIEEKNEQPVRDLLRRIKYVPFS